MTIEQANAVIDEKPHQHVDRDGKPKDGGFDRRLGDRFITELAPLDRPRIAETGTGCGTLVFLSLDPGSVISISPAPELHDRTRAEAAARGIDLAPARFVDDRSEIFAVAQVVCLLREQQPHYEFVAIEGKMATFRKGADLPYLPDWRMEPFIPANTATA